ncbi:MAG: hypothetical protein JXA07_15275 [Spirochaetes bacterium]|nr:hypothetical protein [Spirochaetota bacterium]
MNAINKFTDTDVNTDAIMKEIRHSLALKKMRARPHDPVSDIISFSPENTGIAPEFSVVPAWIKGSMAWMMIKKVNAQIKKIGWYQNAYSRLYAAAERRLAPQNGCYALNQLFRFHGKDFVLSVHSIIFGYEPKTDVVNDYISFLSTRSLTRLDLVWELYHSPEVKWRKIRIKGFPFRYRLKKFLAFL